MQYKHGINIPWKIFMNVYVLCGFIQLVISFGNLYLIEIHTYFIHYSPVCIMGVYFI